MKIYNFHQHRRNISTLCLFFLKSSIIRYQNLSCFGFNQSHKKLLVILNIFLVILPFTGMISNRWLDFQPMVQNYKMAYTDNFKSWKCLETVFLTYLCHQDYIETLGSEFKGFWNVVNWGPIWTRNHCGVCVCLAACLTPLYMFSEQWQSLTLAPSAIRYLPSLECVQQAAECKLNVSGL